MVFLPKSLRHDIPAPLHDHMAKTRRAPVPYEKDIIVIGETMAVRVVGDWFTSNVTIRPRA